MRVNTRALPACDESPPSFASRRRRRALTGSRSRTCPSDDRRAVARVRQRSTWAAAIPRSGTPSCRSQTRCSCRAGGSLIHNAAGRIGVHPGGARVVSGRRLLARSPKQSLPGIQARTYRPFAVRLRIPRSIKVLKTAAHVGSSAAKSRCACTSVTLSPGISAYSARTLRVSSRMLPALWSTFASVSIIVTSPPGRA